MTAIERDIGDITDEQLTAATSDWCYFVKVDMPAPVGVKRFTQFRDFTGNIDGTVATWFNADVRVGRLPQSRANALAVSSLSFANIDYTWTNWAQNYGLRRRNITVYHVRFNADGSLNGEVRMYEGHIDNHSLLTRAEFAIKPFHIPWGRRCVTAVPGLSPLLPAELAPADDEEDLQG